jgi:hypothetical protein
MATTARLAVCAPADDAMYRMRAVAWIEQGMSRTTTIRPTPPSSVRSVALRWSLFFALHGRALRETGEFAWLLAMCATMAKDDDSDASVMVAYRADQFPMAADAISAATAHDVGLTC